MDWPCVTALLAEDFIGRPGARIYEKLQKACEKVGVWPSIRSLILHYLET